MKHLVLLGSAILIVGITACSSTKSGPADYTNADRSAAAPEPDVTTTNEVVTPEPAAIPTKDTPQGSDLNHTTPDQPLYSR